MALAVLALAAIGPGSNEPAEATFPGTNGKIAFASVRNGDFDIYTMNADGSDQTQLTQNLGLLPASAVPAWSPDGQKIAFMSVDFADATFDIYLMNADGSGLTNLTSSFGPRAASPAFSPDGSKIAFAAVTGTTQIHVMNIDGTGITNISNSATYDNQPDWSPDGSKIAFHSYATPGNIEVFVMNADGTGQTNLSNNPTGIDMTPSWSPDGSRIALRRNTGTPEDITYDIFTINPDGTGATNLTNTPDVREFDPSWSPDGTKIAFHKKGTGEAFPDIYVMNADGYGIIRLTDDSLQDIEPAWQPIPLPPTVTPTATNTPTATSTPTPTITPTPTPKDPDGDTDGDGIPNSSDPNDDNDACTDVQENGPDETLGGRRNPHNPWDFYDVAGAPPPFGDGNPDQIIDLPNDILGVIQHYAPTGTEPTYDVDFDRGPQIGANAWNMSAPDGVIDLPNDILGVIRQFNHSCQ